MGWSLRRAYERADHPEKVNVGIVQQNCDRECLVAEGWANTRRLHAGPADTDCIASFCESPEGKPHCDAGRVRILRLGEAEAFGPLFARYLNAKMWRGENYFLQIDAHTDFRIGWDTELVSAIRSTASYPKSLLSNYPPDGDPRKNRGDPKVWPRAKDDELNDIALCECTFETVSGEKSGYTVRLSQTYLDKSSRTSKTTFPRHAAFIAAGFAFLHGSFVKEVPPDPFLPFIFMGEEITNTMRLWTSGFDVYAPRRNVLGHEYVRKHGVKFWESVNMVYSNGGMHNGLTEIIVGRMQYVLGFPESDTKEKVMKKYPADLLVGVQDYGPGKVRSLKAFVATMGLDFGAKTQHMLDWCREGAPAPQSLTTL